MSKIRPLVRKFHSSEYVTALASGEICFVVGFPAISSSRRLRSKPKTGSISAT